MVKNQIIVQLNPDVQPSGSDLAVVNAARRSFGKRSDWETIGYSEMTKRLDEVNLRDYTWVPSGMTGYYRKLKPADKRLIEFLARGMTADDFHQFTKRVGITDWTYVDGAYDLIDLLWQWRNTPEHDTPFNHCFVSFEIKAPIFVRAQLVKHEYTIMSEFSRRYITDDVEFYSHDYRQAAKDKKQGSGGKHVRADFWQTEVQDNNTEQVLLYNAMIEDGVAPEQARGVLPQDLMTAWTWSGTLGAMAKVCRLRLGQDAQAETRYIAEEIYKYLCEYYPVSAPALVKGC
jgi:thymidylate synthase (FAD)